MAKLERHERILALVGERGLLYHRRAVELTGASQATVRRDFEELAGTGAVERIRGGIRAKRDTGNVSFIMREVRQSKEKSAIAAKACGLLRSGDVILVDGGTTTFHLCYHLPKVPLRIITNSLRFAAYLDSAKNRFQSWEIYLTGGQVHHGYSMLTGPGTLHSLDFYHANWAFLSVGGITADGLYNTSESIVETERKMIERCDQAVILADQSKLGRRSMCRVCGIRRIAMLITNTHQGRSLVDEEMREGGLDIRYV